MAKKEKHLTTFNLFIMSTGYKKEYIVKASGVSRNKFYFALKAPDILNKNDVEKLAKALRTPKEVIQAIIDKDKFSKLELIT